MSEEERHIIGNMFLFFMRGIFLILTKDAGAHYPPRVEALKRQYLDFTEQVIEWQEPRTGGG